MPDSSQSRVEQEKKLSLSKSKNNTRTVVLWFGAMVLGGILGYIQSSQINEFFNFIATIFTHLFQFIAVPIIALAVMTTLAALGAKRETGKIFFHAVFYTLTTTIAAAGIALILYILIAPGNIPSALKAGAASVESYEKLSYYQHFLSIVPNNILKPFADGNVLSILFVACAFGLGLAFMPKSPNRDTLIQVIEGTQELLFTLIRALLFILPVGVMAFTGQLVSQLEAGIIVGALGKYVTVVIGGNLIQFFLILPLFLLMRGLSPIAQFKGMSPALAVALFSKSSAGTLPVTLASAEENLKLDHRVTRFILPICTTINMNGCAAFILVTSLFLMQNAGIALTGSTMAIWLLISVLAAIGNAGVPMGCFFLTLSLMSSIHVPIELMGVILPIYAIIDMIETCVNVWSDSCVASMTNHDLKDLLNQTKEETAA